MTLSPAKIILASAAFIVATANLAFLRNVMVAFGGETWGIVHVLSLAILLYFVLVLMLALLTPRPILKPVLALQFFIAAVAAYFMDTYNVIIDAEMLGNVAATNPAEAADLVTGKLWLYVALLGCLPAFLLTRVKVQRQPLSRSFLSRGALAGSAVLILATLVFNSSAFYSSFVREHKSLRYYANPMTPLYAAYKFAKQNLARKPEKLMALGEDAHITMADPDRELVILVVGETARSDHFSLNGYERHTNPELEQKDVISFSQVSACGTSTAISVPCMFSVLPRVDYDELKARSLENVLDVLRHAGVNVLWRDNNSDSKGVADRTEFEDFRDDTVNPVCDRECRDEGMLAGLQGYVDSRQQGDILIVLHQMGSHGPAYYKRYPPAYEAFGPTCDTNQLDSCSKDEVINSYDNTILYTDHVLAGITDFLASNDNEFETVLLYVSDHGESLGEAGLYLHGLPYFVAPKAQTSVPVIFWFGSSYDDADTYALMAMKERPFTHDYVFHTLLGIFEVETEVYQPGLDWLALSRLQAGFGRRPVTSAP